MMRNIVFFILLTWKNGETIKILMYVLCMITHNLNDPCQLLSLSNLDPVLTVLTPAFMRRRAPGVEIVSLSAESLNAENGQ